MARRDARPYDVSTGEGQKRLMAESVGHTFVPRSRVVAADGDYGTNPAPESPGMVRMHPSGELVTIAEAQRRLAARRR